MKPLRLLVSILCTCLGTASIAEVRYTVTDLGPGIGSALNDAGQVTFYFEHGTTYPFGPTYLWDGAHLAYLPLSSLPPGYLSAVVYAENDSGQLAGWVSRLTDPYHPEQSADAAFWPNGASQPPVLFGKTSDVGVPMGLSASGQVLLHNLSTGLPSVWRATTGLDPLPTLGGTTVASAISEAGLIVGTAIASDGVIHAVTWSDGQIHQLEMGTWEQSRAQAVASDGEVAGFVSNQDGSQALLALWSPTGALQTFPVPGTGGVNVNAVNDAHQVVGYANGYGSFIFEGGTFTALRGLIPAGESINFAGEHLNNVGQILCTRWKPWTSDPNEPTYQDTVLLTPIPPMARALAITGGLQAASSSDVAALTQTGSGTIGLVDAVRLARKATGLDR